MSASISSTGYGALTQTVTDSNRTKQTINQLSEETSSGYISDTFAGLGSGAASALDLSPQLAANTQLQANTASAGSIQTAAQAAFGQIETIASSFATQATQLIGLQGTVGGIAANAQNALTQVANLLNTKVGNVYVFAGQDSANPPIPDPLEHQQFGLCAGDPGGDCRAGHQRPGGDIGRHAGHCLAGRNHALFGRAGGRCHAGAGRSRRGRIRQRRTAGQHQQHGSLAKCGNDQHGQLYPRHPAWIGNPGFAHPGAIERSEFHPAGAGYADFASGGGLIHQ